MRPRVLAVLAGVIVVLCAAPAAANAGVPRSFVGMGIDGPFFYPGMNQSAQLAQMVADGIGSVRTEFAWGDAQPYPNFASVPANLRSQFADVGGVPTNFSAMDNVVALAAAHGLTVLPVIEYSPPWDSQHPGSSAAPPKNDGPYASFAAALVERYGPHGSFWTQNPGLPRVPITMWQVWNEPNFVSYWSQRPWIPSYVRLLRAAHAAIKKADPHAKIILAGLANFSWEYLTSIYHIRGARGLFDIVDSHPYTATPQGVITILGYLRAVMDKFGDRHKPLFATEISWPSAKGEAKVLFENETTEQGQAQKLGKAIRLLAKNRRRLGLTAFYYYTWITNETLPLARQDPFNFAGLFKFFNGVGTVVKPAYSAFVDAVGAIER